VIEDQRHRAAPPDFVLPTKLTPPLLEASLEQPLFQVPPVVGRILDEDLFEWDR
jgi:hypothetical protein